jgi:hypothetical protein
VAFNLSSSMTLEVGVFWACSSDHSGFHTVNFPLSRMHIATREHWGRTLSLWD